MNPAGAPGDPEKIGSEEKFSPPVVCNDYKIGMAAILDTSISILKYRYFYIEPL